MLTVGQRQGSSPGMLQSREFRLVMAGGGGGTGVGADPSPARTVIYSGENLQIRLADK